MDIDEPGSGGSTPLQDEPEYDPEEGNEIEDARSPDSDGGPQSANGAISQANDGDDYFSDGGEVEREEVQRDVDDEDDDVVREEVERVVEDDQEYQPGSDNEGAGPGSVPASPASGSVASPPASPMSLASGPQSPAGSPPGSPMSVERSGSEPGSPARSRSVSPRGSGPPSPAGSGPGSPAGSGPGSPAGSGPGSPAGSGPGSPAGSGPGSPAGSGPPSPAGSGPQSPGSSGSRSPKSPSSRPASPAGSEPRSPAGSGPRSPTGSRPQSPAGSGPQSPTGSGPRSPFGSGPQSPASPMFSAPNSPVASPIVAGIELFLEESQPKSPVSDRDHSPVRSRSRSRSPSYSPVSGSPAGSGPGSPPGSPGASSDKENDAASEIGEEHVTKKRRIISDDESDRDENEEAEDTKKGRGSDDDDSDKESIANGLIEDIFGPSDEDEEFEGFGEADVEAHAKKKERKKSSKYEDEDNDASPGTSAPQEVVPELSEDENEEALRKDAKGGELVYDFDLMLEKKKQERQKQRRRRKDDVDMINDSDDLIAEMIGQMKIRAEEDRELNNQRKAATKKLTYLPFVLSQLNKIDLHSKLLSGGILSAITEWLAPLPDRSLPHLSIRENMLKLLKSFPRIEPEDLKLSGIGKAVMYLHKHPRELRDNKTLAGKLIHEWSRPIFNLETCYSSFIKGDREQRDYDQLPKKRKLSLDGSQTPRRDIDNALAGENRALRPGDPGWVYRARVPAPSNKDYVVRPRSEVEYIAKRGQTKKPVTRYDKHARAFAEKKKNSKAQRAVGISIEGRNMAL